MCQVIIYTLFRISQCFTEFSNKVQNIPKKVLSSVNPGPQSDFLGQKGKIHPLFARSPPESVRQPD